MASLLDSLLGRKKPSRTRKIRAPEFVRTSYSSLPVDIPADFLIGPPKDGNISVSKIDFESTALKEYKGCYAVVLDGVLSEDECKQLIHLAQCSVPRDEKDKDGEVKMEGAEEVEVEGEARVEESKTEKNGTLGAAAWSPAMVNAGPGFEIFDPDYRNSDRIIWNEQEVVNRLWDRCCMAEGVKEAIQEVRRKKYRGIGDATVVTETVWKVTKLNERMRFLKYGAGQFFKPHVDSAYYVPDKDEKTFYTIHLYLNDSIQELKKGKTGKELAAIMKKTAGDLASERLCEGGATTFHSNDMESRIDVDPKIGRVLIFQHEKLLHSGDDVIKGFKFTMRTDLQFEKVV